MSIKFRKTPVVAALALAAASPFSHAQLMLEEIIVTAQKRAESLQDVPISVSAMQGEKIAEAGINSMSQIADYIPNLHIAEAPVNTNIYMRGMGSGNNQAFEQSVGMYIDGIYMGRGRQYRSPFMDIERVEVLRGPQGTLFGKNTVAGAVNILTASPDLDEPFEGNISASAESNSGYQVEGVLSGALTENFALRGAFKYRESDGWADNSFLNEDEPNTDETVWRLTGVWQITDDLDANFKYSQAEYNRDGVGSGSWRYLDSDQRAAEVPNASDFANTAYLVTDVYYPDFANKIKDDFDIFKDNGYGPDGKTRGIGKNVESSDNDIDNFSMTLNYYMGEYTITSVTGYSEYNYVDGADVDWLPLQFVHRDDDQDFDQWSQEIRITSPTGGFFEYIGGAYYEQSNLSFNRRVTIDSDFGGLFSDLTGAPSLLWVLTSGAYSAAQIARNHKYDLDSDSWAVFGQGTFNLADDWRLTLGLRYTEETKDVRSTQILSDDITGLNVSSDNFFLGFIQNTEFNTYAYDYDEDRDTDKWLPSVNLQWDFSDDSMFYASFSQGFKSGGFTSADDGQPGGLQQGEFNPAYDPNLPSDEFEFDDEDADAFEIGGKHTLLDGAMTLNWAAFYTSYSDLQISIFKGLGFTVTNADADVSGLEVDALWQATEGLRLGLNAAYLDAEWKNYEQAPCTAIQLDNDPLCGVAGGFTDNDQSNETTTFAPEYSGSLFFDYSYMLGNGMEIFAGGEANYSDDFSSAGDKDPIDDTESFTKINLRIGLRGAGENWEIMAYGRNITDENVYSISFDTPVLAGSHSAQFDEGAVYGVRAGYRF
ncbi:MAG: TonB-dependent receptor [Marinobacter sp.]|uniref:TonB-dependent receptor n=1 Tax=Marinobacter sp. TaxID=50741 RepID=UPI00329879AB